MALWGAFACVLVPGTLLATGKSVELAFFAAVLLGVLLAVLLLALRSLGGRLSQPPDQSSQ